MSDFSICFSEHRTEHPNYFIKWFVGGTVYKMWEKTAKYYALINGKPIRTNGVTNQTKTPSKRMEEFLKGTGTIK